MTVKELSRKFPLGPGPDWNHNRIGTPPPANLHVRGPRHRHL